MLNKVNIKANPTLEKLLTDSEKHQDPSTISNEMLLKKWVNFHLQASMSSLQLTNFSSDLSDGQIYATLLGKLSYQDKKHTDSIRKLSQRLATITSKSERVQLVLQMTETLGCKRMITADDIIQGSKERNMIFVAYLMDKFPSLEEALSKHANRIAAISLETMDLERSGFQGQISGLKEEIYRLERERDGSVKEARLLRQQLDAHVLKVNELERQSETLNAELMHKSNRVRDIEAQYHQVLLRNKSNLETIENLQKNQDELVTEQTIKLEEELKEAQKERDELELALSQAEEQLKEMSQQAEEAQVALEETHADSKKFMVTRLNEFASLLNGTNEPFDDTDPDTLIQRVFDEFKAQKDRNTSAGQQCATLTTQLETAQSKIAEIEQSVIPNYEQTITKLRSAITVHESAIDKFQQKDQEQKLNSDETDKQVSELKQRVSELEEELKTRDADIAQWKILVESTKVERSRETESVQQVNAAMLSRTRAMLESMRLLRQSFKVEERAKIETDFNLQATVSKNAKLIQEIEGRME
jgi:chromosome segregation ATPase